MKYIFILLAVSVVTSCSKDPEIPECIENMKDILIEAADSGDVQCATFAYIDEYTFQGYYVYFIPSMCFYFAEPGSGGIYKDDCTYMTEIGLANEREFDGEKFSDTAEFERRIWSYGE